MKRFIQTFLIAIGLAGSMAMMAPAPEAGAINVFGGCGGRNSGTEVCSARSRDNVNSIVRTVIDVLFWAIAIVAVIMIILGGIKYVTSNGDSAKITSAKNTVLYSVIGLVVALLAYAIVAFVIDRFR